MNGKTVSVTLKKMRNTNPLIHNITNIVVANFSANGLLAAGASPVMASAPEEAADMAKLADALVLNLGTLANDDLEAMILAGKAANKKGIPVVLDPVGVGSTPFRIAVAEKILEEIDVNIIRGNGAEIANLIGENWEIKGVDAGNWDRDVVTLTKKAAQKLHCIVIATGKADTISDGTTTYLVENGDALLTKVTGSGCLLSTIVGAFATADKDLLTAATAALIFYGIAAEQAAEKTRELGPGNFQIEFINQLSLIGYEEINRYSAFAEI